MVNKKKVLRQIQQKLVGMVCLLVLVCGLAAVPAQAAAIPVTIDEAMKKSVEWGILRSDIDGNLDVNKTITRADFVAMVNRAYGYTDVGPNPFTDVKSSDWFYEDICIAHKIGFFKGITATTANPNGLLTREQAAVLIGRNMMLEESNGESLGFADSRTFNEYSRHMIQAVAEHGIINGYADGLFRPRNHVTRGHVAAMLVRAIGTPIQEPGEYKLGGVYGNLTITSPGVTLKNTTVVGDLLITGGLGLSDLALENVTVTGRIVVSGTGEAEKGNHSVTLRNVAASELLVDSINHQFVTLKAEGLTDIKEVNVRTSAYLEDLTENGLGLQIINLEGEDGTQFSLAGNIKDVVNLTTNSTLNLAQGIAASVTVDESALGSTLNIAKGTLASTVNLDAAANVIGDGDMNHLNVNAAGSTVAMLPDTVDVRPGITANIYGETMDTVAAKESSADPRLLSGYPAAKNVAPTSAEIVFETNKKGTIYWALTALSDGSVKEEDLISPPAYSGKILKSGVINATASKTEFRTKLSGLTTDGSYYVSAILVDNRGMRSPVKIAAFTTPDNTVPAFSTGYPYTIIADGSDNEQIVQAMVMANKNCVMYYALMPKGSTAPKAAEFKANAVSGNLGYGMVDLRKNTPFLVSKVNNGHLKEETSYELYLWLTDADGVKSSAVKKLTVTTLDRTPPKLQHLTVTDIASKSVTLTYALNEPGTMYWAIVKKGAQFYTSEADGYYATKDGMIQVESGINALKKGSSNASKATTDYKFTISGLESQTAYDVYYVIKDKAGNYGVYDLQSIELPYTVHTLDTEPPTVYQEFTHDGSSGSSLSPYPDTSIRLVFSEDIQGMLDLDGDSKKDKTSFLDFYATCKSKNEMDKFAETMREYIKLYTSDGEQVAEATKATNKKQDDWVIDYRYATVEMDSSGTGELIITFPYNKDAGHSALNLSGGVTYYFTVAKVADKSTKENEMVNTRGVTKLPPFTTISAQILLSETYAEPSDNLGIDAFDMTFTAKPISHDAMADGVKWDLFVWSDTSIKFNLYESLDNGETWTQVKNGAKTEASISTTTGTQAGVSIDTALRGGAYEKDLKKLETRVYGIKITSIKGESNSTNWNEPVTVMISAVSGSKGFLGNAADQMNNKGSYDMVVGSSTKVSDISIPLNFTLTHTFVDRTPPGFASGYPTISAGDSTVTMKVALDRSNTSFYYVVAPLGDIPTILTAGTGKYLDQAGWATLPKYGAPQHKDNVTATLPTNETIVNFRAKAGNPSKGGNGEYDYTVETISVNGLTPKTKYVAYFVLQGESQDSYSQVYCFAFETGDVMTPTIQLFDESPGVGIKTSTDAEVVWFLMLSTNLQNTSPFKDKLTDIASGKETAFANKYPSGITVLEALETDMGGGNMQSVFDYYAGPDIYDRVYRAVVESTSYTNRTDYGSLDTTAGRTATVFPNGMSAYPAQYYFVAAARNTLSDNTTSYAFKAIAPIHQTDTTPPSITVCTTTLEKAVKGGTTLWGQNNILDPAQNTNPASMAYDGYVTLTFSEIPYRLYQDPATNVTTRKELSGDLKQYISATGGTVDSATASGNTITIKFKGVSNTGTLTLFNPGVISDASGNTQNNKQLVLRFTAPTVAIQGGVSGTPGTPGTSETPVTPVIEYQVATKEWQ